MCIPVLPSLPTFQFNGYNYGPEMDAVDAYMMFPPCLETRRMCFRLMPYNFEPEYTEEVSMRLRVVETETEKESESEPVASV